jgi:glucose/arabinose dehydrogenase
MRRLVLRIGALCAPAALAAACASDAGGVATGPPPGSASVGLEEVASGLNFPVYLAAPPGGTGRLFIVEKGGVVRIVDHGVLLSMPFPDIGDRVSSGAEQGLLGLAFTPAYASSGRFVVDYTTLSGDTRISLFTVSGDPNRADPASEVVLFAVEQPFGNHNGGQVVFGPDGYLYVGLGDGGGAGDPMDRAQNLGDVLGSILRLDPAAGSAPEDNPFQNRAGARPEIWSYGLRNPWRFSFDRLTGDLYVADVGQDRWEEVSVSPAPDGGRAVNFGWNRMEGLHCFTSGSCPQDGLTHPLLEYGHDQGCSITGGYVYRGAAVPEIQGHYFYADFCRGWVRSFRYHDGQVTDQAQWPALEPGGSVPSLGEDAAGDLYLLSSVGRVFKIVRR